MRNQYEWPFNALDHVFDDPEKWPSEWRHRFPLSRAEELGLQMVKSQTITEDQMKGFLAAVASIPKERDRDCLLQYFRDGKTYREIGESYGITLERVRQLVTRAERHLRKNRELIVYGSN